MSIPASIAGSRSGQYHRFYELSGQPMPQALTSQAAKLAMAFMFWSAASGADWSQDDAVNQARNFLAGELHIDSRRLDLVGIVARTWPDASLGCPRKGEMYAQTLVSGYEVELAVGSAQYRVHVARGASRRCDASAAAKTADRERALKVSAASRGARLELARQLRVAPERIRVLAVERHATEKLPDACANADFIVRLSYRGRRFSVAADTATQVFCRL